jgi:hypothetical protein
MIYELGTLVFIFTHVYSMSVNVTHTDPNAWCIAANGIQICSTPRCAGAIDHVSWNGKQFISDFDHGRELQVAVTSDNTGECFNPTEAGANNDGQGPLTSSRLLGINLAGNVLRTTSLPAYWMWPGTCEPGCGCARNTVKTSNNVMNKAVSIGGYGVANSIQFQFDITIPENHGSVQIESPTGYQWAEFNTYFRFNKASGQISVEAACINCMTEHPDPLIISTQDHAYAIGSYIYNSPPGTISYAQGYFPGPGTFQTSKWSNVWRVGVTPAGTKYAFLSFVCVGNLDMVVDCLRKLPK